MPWRFQEMPIPLSAQGIWMHSSAGDEPALHASAWLGVSGASDAPKSTVRAVICAIPAPEPTAE